MYIQTQKKVLSLYSNFTTKYQSIGNNVNYKRLGISYAFGDVSTRKFSIPVKFIIRILILTKYFNLLLKWRPDIEFQNIWAKTFEVKLIKNACLLYKQVSQNTLLMFFYVLLFETGVIKHRCNCPLQASVNLYAQKIELMGSKIWYMLWLKFNRAVRY